MGAEEPQRSMPRILRRPRVIRRAGIAAKAVPRTSPTRLTGAAGESATYPAAIEDSRRFDHLRHPNGSDERSPPAEAVPDHATAGRIDIRLGRKKVQGGLHVVYNQILVQRRRMGPGFRELVVAKAEPGPGPVEHIGRRHLGSVRSTLVLPPYSHSMVPGGLEVIS